MSFNSLQYAALLAGVFVVYWQLARRQQNVLLLIASYVFYGAWDVRFLPLMWFSTAVDYVVGRLLERETNPARRKRIFAVSLVVNLGVLGVFKYFNFFMDSADNVFHLLGADLDSPTLRVLLPIGISFYTFHGISYTFDVYRGHIRAARSPLDFAVFVAFFPQLVAGPIGRAHLQLPQFQNDRRFPDGERIASGLFLILLGLFKKVVIADGVARYADLAFSTAGGSWIVLLFGVYAFAIQIYADFSGYSDIARGSSRLLGIELPRNFEQPYLSRNITEFWRRWHISLSSWLRDYLYVPLGGNRGGTRKTYRNLMITMVLGGLWHGAAWTFVIWGLMQGLMLSVHRWWTQTVHHHREPLMTGDTHTIVSAASAAGGSGGGAGASAGLGAGGAGGAGGAATLMVTRPEPEDPSRARTVFWVIVTFHLVCASWIFFRSDSLRIALRYFKGLLTFRGGPVDWDAIFVVVPAAAVMLAIDLAQRRTGRHAFGVCLGPVALGAVVAALVAAILVFSGGTSVPFIYFQF